jgi:hypothetical protein
VISLATSPEAKAVRLGKLSPLKGLFMPFLLFKAPLVGFETISRMALASGSENRFNRIQALPMRQHCVPTEYKR